MMNGFTIPSDLLDEIASRCILDSVTSEEMANPTKFCFLIEIAYWFYLDEYVEESDSLNSVKFENFATQILKHLKVDFPNGRTTEEVLYDFREYKKRVPTCGGLLLTHDLAYVLLVQGYWHRASWGFPKGKIMENEKTNLHKCAIREVMEETGFDISTRIDEDDYLEGNIGEQQVRLYVIPDVPADTVFAPTTKGEIKEIRWFPVSNLPTYTNGRRIRSTLLGPASSFSTVIPFVKPLQNWIKDRLAITGKDRLRRYFENQTAIQLKLPQYSDSSPPSKYTSRRRGTVPVLGPGSNQVLQSGSSNGSTASKRSKKNKKETEQEEDETQLNHQKFTFKCRPKKDNSVPTDKEQAKLEPPTVCLENLPQPVRSDPSAFFPVTWSTFKLNSEAIDDALTRSWIEMQL